MSALLAEGGEKGFIEFDADLRAYVVDGAVLEDGVYLVFRLGEST